MYVQAHKAQRVTTCVSCCRDSSYRAKARRALARTAFIRIAAIVAGACLSVADANHLPRYRLRHVVADVSAEALGLRLQGQSERRKHPARRIAFD